MTVVAFALAAFFSALLWIVSGRFRPLLERRKRVVMQWSLTGKPTSTASPRAALAVTPAVGTATLFLVACVFAFGTPAEDREAAPLAVAAIGAVLVAIHAGHMYFAVRSDVR